MSEAVPKDNDASAMEEKTILQAEGLTKCYTIGRRKIEVLHGVDMEVKQGG